MDLYLKLRKKVMRQLRALQIFKPEIVPKPYMYKQMELRKWRRQMNASLVAVQFVNGLLDGYKLSKQGWINGKKSEKHDYVIYVTHIVMDDRKIVALVTSNNALYISNSAKGAKIIKTTR